MHPNGDKQLYVHDKIASCAYTPDDLGLLGIELFIKLPQLLLPALVVESFIGT
jgi:hypothetical protein